MDPPISHAKNKRKANEMERKEVPAKKPCTQAAIHPSPTNAAHAGPFQAALVPWDEVISLSPTTAPGPMAPTSPAPKPKLRNNTIAPAKSNRSKITNSIPPATRSCPKRSKVGLSITRRIQNKPTSVLLQAAKDFRDEINELHIVRDEIGDAMDEKKKEHGHAYKCAQEKNERKQLQGKISGMEGRAEKVRVELRRRGIEVGD
ncbi:hypothetical protein N0V90_011280 [Kalmusia sp. IMI 367209]|nr:hypothetical protein N0V90_011280 [Kalmusia sp. IMI 367209]